MRSLIILKGLSKSDKLRWVKDQGLENYFVDFNIVKRLFSSPELITSDGKSVLGRAYSDTVYKRYIEIVCTRLSKGCLVVLDIENEALNIFNLLAFIFGYTIFYVTTGIPKDYVRNYEKYVSPGYSKKKKEELLRDIDNYKRLDFSNGIIIESYQDVIDYWTSGLSSSNTMSITSSDKILYVSDLHSNYSLYKKLPKFSNYKKVIMLGDYIDGPENLGSRRLIDVMLNDMRENVVWLEGNHELRLRKYLGSIIFKHLGKIGISEILLNYLPPDFFTTTAIEFKVSFEKAQEYLSRMNEKLKMFYILNNGLESYYCTHAGFKFIGQIDPKFIGNVIYGTRDIISYDREFSKLYSPMRIISIHAHCKYQDQWVVNRYKNVYNLDPPDEYEVVYIEQQYNKLNICQIRTSGM